MKKKNEVHIKKCVALMPSICFLFRFFLKLIFQGGGEFSEMLFHADKISLLEREKS